VAMSYMLIVRKEGKAPAIYKRSGHVAAGHVLLPFSPLYYSLLLLNIKRTYKGKE
jgi:hypothetical protein